jgi:PHD/YefM family antitoxin component YafN of YafNO toxin-antitoxin module
MSVLKIEATKAKAGFAKLPEKAKSKDLEITRHGRVKGYFISPEQYQRLKSLERADGTALEKLELQFQEMARHMQTAKHRQAVGRIESVDLDDILAAANKKPRTSELRTRRFKRA